MPPQQRITSLKKPAKKTVKKPAKKPVKKSAKKTVKPAAKKSVAKKPAAKKSVAKKPAVKKSAANKPAAKKTVRKTSPKKIEKKAARKVAKKLARVKAAKPVFVAEIQKPVWPAMVEAVLQQLDESKAEQIVAIDLTRKTTIADTMVVASGRSSRHVNAVADQVVERLERMGKKNIRIEGVPQCDWVLVDAGDLVVHVFRPEVRSFYNLEKLWSDAAP